MVVTKPIAWIFYVVVLLICNSTNAQVITTTLEPTVRNVTELNIGFNRRSDQGTWWTDTSFINLVDDMNPDIVRYPAGTQANYWDWSTGQFIPNTDKVWNNKEVVTIPTFLNALPQRTKVVYVVNMARPTPATGIDVNASEAVLKSQSTRNAKITDILNALAEFTNQGKTPYAIELGNEFYFGNIESGIFEIIDTGTDFLSGWDTANNQPYSSSSKADATEITATFYLDQCIAIVAAIKAVYPNMKFVLTTTKGGTAARDRWNNTIFTELETNPNYSVLKNNVYAVSQHHYLNDNYGVQTPIGDNATAEVAIAEGIQYPIDKQVDYDVVPSDYKIWYTEYGEVKGIAEETWASAIRFEAFAYSWLTRGDKVGQLGWHYISDNNVVNDNNSPMKLAPVGIASKLLSQASADMTDMQKINFGNNPIAVNGVNALHGFTFKSNEKETVFIINISDTDFAQVPFNNLITYTGQPIMTQYYSNAPYVSGVFEGHSNIVSTVGSVNTAIDIHKFSITVIEVPNSTLGLEDTSQKKRSVYPNPFQDHIVFKDVNTVKSVAIFNINGSLVFKTSHLESKILKLEGLPSGMYFAKIESDAVHTVKLIKQ